jgi:hypothetical protein
VHQIDRAQSKLYQQNSVDLLTISRLLIRSSPNTCHYDPSMHQPNTLTKPLRTTNCHSPSILPWMPPLQPYICSSPPSSPLTHPFTLLSPPVYQSRFSTYPPTCLMWNTYAATNATYMSTPMSTMKHANSNVPGLKVSLLYRPTTFTSAAGSQAPPTLSAKLIISKAIGRATTPLSILKK